MSSLLKPTLFDLRFHLYLCLRSAVIRIQIPNSDRGRTLPVDCTVGQLQTNLAGLIFGSGVSTSGAFIFLMEFSSFLLQVSS